MKTMILRVEVADAFEPTEYYFEVASTHRVTPTVRWTHSKTELVEPAPTPTFEVGKRYRTRGGQLVTIIKLDHDDRSYPLGGRFDGQTRLDWWTSTGNYRKYATSDQHLDLRPGAIEDEKAIDPYNLLQRQIDAIQKRIGDSICLGDAQIAAMAAKIGELSQDVQRIDNIEKHCEALQGAREEHTKQIGTLQEAQVKTFARLHHHHLGLPTLGELAAEGKRYACTGQAIEPAKTTIKGGWANVYRNFRKMWIGNICATRDEAEQSISDGERIACIQIPDIIVGEGLGNRASELTAADFIRFSGDAGGGQ